MYEVEIKASPDHSHIWIRADSASDQKQIELRIGEYGRFPTSIKAWLTPLQGKQLAYRTLEAVAVAATGATTAMELSTHDRVITVTAQYDDHPINLYIKGVGATRGRTADLSYRQAMKFAYRLLELAALDD